MTSSRRPPIVRRTVLVPLPLVTGDEVTLLSKALPQRPLLDRHAGALIPGQLLNCRERAFGIEEQVVGVEPADRSPLGCQSWRSWLPAPTITRCQPQRLALSGGPLSPALVT